MIKEYEEIKDKTIEKLKKILDDKEIMGKLNYLRNEFCTDDDNREFQRKFIEVAGEWLIDNRIADTEEMVTILYGIYMYNQSDETVSKGYAAINKEYNSMVTQAIEQIEFDKENIIDKDILISYIKGYKLNEEYRLILSSYILSRYKLLTYFDDLEPETLNKIARTNIPINHISKDTMTNLFINEFNDLIKRYQVNPDDSIYASLEKMISENYKTIKTREN